MTAPIAPPAVMGGEAPSAAAPESDAIVRDLTPVLPDTLDGLVSVWQALDRRDDPIQWRRAEICATISARDSARGNRSGEPTEIQQFCRAVGISESTFSRLAKTWRTFKAGPTPLDPVSRGLVPPGIVRFSHYYYAANYGGPLPGTDLIEASQHRWTPTEFRQMLAAHRRYTLIGIDGEPLAADTAADVVTDDDARLGRVDRSGRVREIREKRTVSPPNCAEIRLLVPKTEAKILKYRLRKLAGILGTTRVDDTIIAMTARAFTEWVEHREARTVCPRCGEDLPAAGGGTPDEATDDKI